MAARYALFTSTIVKRGPSGATISMGVGAAANSARKSGGIDTVGCFIRHGIRARRALGQWPLLDGCL